MNVRSWLLGLAFCLSLGVISCKSKTGDADLQSAFNEKKQEDNRLSNVTASVQDGVLTLNGQCPDEACRTAAEQAAKDVKGAKSVVNNITVTAPAPVEISTDTALENGLKDATKDYPGVTATVANGEVTLTGTVERSRLPQLMQAVNGLSPRKVNNNLTVK